MANFEDIIFIIQFLAFFSILLYKLNNILNTKKDQDIPTMIILFIVQIISYGVGLSFTMINYTSYYMLTLFKLQSWSLVLALLFTFIEIVLIGSKHAANTQKKAYNAKDFYFPTKLK